MPPKKQPAGPSKKTVDKQKQKVIEDKTFGLKNKNKSTKVQKYVQTVEKVVKQSGPKKPQKDAPPKKTKAELEQEKKDELQSLFKVTQKAVPKGVDPKSVLCEFFKQGMCTKGDKCKLSHDLNVARKAEKIDLYTDRREGEAKSENMETGNWSQAKLEEVVKANEEKSGRKNQSEIVCKYFLEAVETRKYGWFWVCPNGGESCQYRHALPPGYQLKDKTKKEDEEKPEEPPIEDIIEEERKKLTTRTPVTLDLFLKWKTDRQKRLKVEQEEADRKRNEELKRGTTQMSGREMFEFRPELFVDDDEAFGADDYIGNPEDREEIQEVVLEATGTSLRATIKNKGKGIDGSGPIDESLFTDDDLVGLEDDAAVGGENGDHADGEENGVEEDGEEEDEEDGEEEEEDNDTTNGDEKEVKKVKETKETKETK